MFILKKLNLITAKQIILALSLALCFQGLVLAEEKVGVEDRIIGSTFKTLAKAFVLAVDINKLKKNNINKLNKMSEEKFSKRYAKAYAIIKDLPPKLKESYGITEAMTKETAIRNTESLDKNKIYEIIDSIPDEVIAKQFKQYLSDVKEDIGKSSAVEQINKLWNKIIGKADVK